MPRFHEYSSLCPYLRGKHGTLENYNLAINALKFGDRARLALQAERSWSGNDKPYYLCYPKIMDALLKIKIEKIPAQSISFPEPVTLFRLPEGHNVGSLPDCFLFCWEKVKRPDGTGIRLVINTKEKAGDHTLVLMKTFPSDVIDFEFVMWEVKRLSRAAILPAFKLAVAIGMLARDTDIVQQQICERFCHLCPEQAIQRSREKGLYGFEVGRDLEVDPHFRASHLCNQPWGQGRKLRKIILRNGCIVKRKMVVSVPSGFGEELQ